MKKMGNEICETCSGCTKVASTKVAITEHYGRHGVYVSEGQ